MVVLSCDPHYLTEALKLSNTLNLPLVNKPDSGLFLYVSDRLELGLAGSNMGPVSVDFNVLAKRKKQAKDLIAKAVGIKGSYRPSIVDATAGLGQDAFVLADYGCQVTMIERSAMIAVLLQDGLERAKGLDAISRLSFILGDAKDILTQLSEKPEVIYLDPMYPESNKTAAKRKEMRLFRELVGDDLDVEALLELALHTAQKRVVLKRPLKAPTWLRPNTVYKGSTVRFDVYLPK